MSHVEYQLIGGALIAGVCFGLTIGVAGGLGFEFIQWCAHRIERFTARKRQSAHHAAL